MLSETAKILDASYKEQENLFNKELQKFLQEKGITNEDLLKKILNSEREDINSEP